MKFRKNKKMGRTADLDVQTRKLAKPKTALQYHKKYNTSPEQSQALYNTLVRKYGKPKSIRGQSHVWDIKNPSRGGSQADIVTVIMKISKNGEYELVMDRDRGEDGRATWAAPRMKKLVVEKPHKKALKKHLILQPDND